MPFVCKPYHLMLQRAAVHPERRLTLASPFLWQERVTGADVVARLMDGHPRDAIEWLAAHWLLRGGK
jgi:hypothetical protein